MQRLAGYLYQANPRGGLAEAFPIGTLRSDLPDWVKVDDGAFVDDLEPAAPAAPEDDEAESDDEDEDEDQGDLTPEPLAKAPRRRSAR